MMKTIKKTGLAPCPQWKINLTKRNLTICKKILGKNPKKKVLRIYELLHTCNFRYILKKNIFESGVKNELPTTVAKSSAF